MTNITRANSLISYEISSYSNLEANTNQKKNIKNTFIKTNYNENYNELISEKMGTTANLALITSNYIYIANIGDSLAVMYKNGKAEKLNEEHKISVQSEINRINNSGSKIINNRIEGRLNLTRAIGNINKIYIKSCYIILLNFKAIFISKKIQIWGLMNNLLFPTLKLIKLKSLMTLNLLFWLVMEFGIVLKFRNFVSICPCGLKRQRKVFLKFYLRLLI